MPSNNRMIPTAKSEMRFSPAYDNRQLGGLPLKGPSSRPNQYAEDEERAPMSRPYRADQEDDWDDMKLEDI